MGGPQDMSGATHPEQRLIWHHVLLHALWVWFCWCLCYICNLFWLCVTWPEWVGSNTFSIATWYFPGMIIPG